MILNEKITSPFNQFAGREVNIVVEESDHSMPVVKVASDDPAIGELRQAAQANGLALRVHIDGFGGYTDYEPRRLNVLVQQDDDGKNRIQQQFRIG